MLLYVIPVPSVAFLVDKCFEKHLEQVAHGIKVQFAFSLVEETIIHSFIHSFN